MPPRKITKRVYTRSSPLVFVVWALDTKVQKNFHAVFASLYGFAALADWRFGISQNDCPEKHGERTETDYR